MAVHHYNNHAVTLEFADSDDFDEFLDVSTLGGNADYLAPLVSPDELVTVNAVLNEHLQNACPQQTLTLKGNGRWSLFHELD